MKVRDKKLIVFRQLSQEADPVSLHELLGLLPDDFISKERSVRRWLNELVQEGLVERFGQKRATKYRVASKNSGRHVSKGERFGSDSLKAIKQIRRPIYERQPIAYNDTWFDSYQPNISFNLSEVLRNQLHETGQRSKRQDPAGTYAHQIFNRLLIDLSYNSSRLEGNTYSLLDTERLLLQGSSAEGKLDEEKIMILNHKEAIRHLVDNAPHLNISLQTICTLHYLLADGLVEAKDAGKVRSHSVRVGGTTYLPFEDPKRLQIQLERIVEKASLIKDLFEQSIFLLIHISYLQAFADVNKRTARLSANIPLIIGNLVPLSFNDVERDDYISAMIAIYELNDIHPLVDLYTYSYMRTCAAYDATIKTIGFDEIRVRYRQQRRAILREIIIKRLVGEKIDEFIQHAVQVIPEVDKKAFVEDVMEDLAHMDSSRILGMGLSHDELKEWLEFEIKVSGLSMRFC